MAISWQRRVALDMGWCQDDQILESFWSFQKRGFLYLGIQDIWISGSSGHILGTRRATGDLLVAKLPHFLELFRYYKTIRFWITEFLVALSRRQKKLPETHWMQNYQICKAFQIFESIWFFGFFLERYTYKIQNTPPHMKYKNPIPKYTLINQLHTPNYQIHTP